MIQIGKIWQLGMVVDAKCVHCRSTVNLKKVKLRIEVFCPGCEQKRAIIETLQASETFAGVRHTTPGTAALEQVARKCVYCGHAAQCLDHIIPLLYKLSRRRKNEKSTGEVVDSCLECNSILGAKLIPTVTDRANHLLRQKKVKKRYSDARLEHLSMVASKG